jgi:hypothetical protein
MTKQPIGPVQDERGDDAEAVGDDKRSIASLAAEVERVRGDADVTARVKRILERDRDLLDRLGRWPEA